MQDILIELLYEINDNINSKIILLEKKEDINRINFNEYKAIIIKEKEKEMYRFENYKWIWKIYTNENGEGLLNDEEMKEEINNYLVKVEFRSMYPHTYKLINN